MAQQKELNLQNPYEYHDDVFILGIMVYMLLNNKLFMKVGYYNKQNSKRMLLFLKTFPLQHISTLYYVMMPFGWQKSKILYYIPF